MLTHDQIREVVSASAGEFLHSSELREIRSSESLDSDGRDALDVTLVLKQITADTLTGDKALDLMVSISSALFKAGEHRATILGFTTKEEDDEELMADGNSQS